MMHPELPGWQIAAKRFDCGAAWGVGIERVREGVKRRYAVRIDDGSLDEREAVERALPTLRNWAGVS